VLLAELRIDIEEIFARVKRAHMRVQMRGLDAELKRAFDLRPQFDLDLLRRGFHRRLPLRAPHKSLFVEQALYLFGRSHWTPAKIFPFAGQSQMQTQIKLRVLSGVGRDLREPRAGNHDTARSDQPFFESLDRRGVDRM